MRITSLRPRASLPVACVAIMVAAGVAVSTAAPAAAPAPSAPSAQAGGRTLSIAVQNATQVIPVAVGLRHGFFKKAGITNIKFTLFLTLSPLLTSVAQGQIDVGTQIISTLNNYNRATSGTKLKFIAADTTNTQFWAAPTGSNMPVATKTNWKRTVLAWKGKKVGVTAAGGFLDLQTKWMIKEVGLSPSDVTLAYVGAGPAAAAALKNGVVDVVCGDASMMSQLIAEKAGHPVIAAVNGQGPAEFKDIIIASWFTSQESLQKDRATYVAFTKGIVRARAFMRNPKNKKDVIDILVRKIGLTPEAAAVFYRIGVPGTKNSSMSPRVYNKTIQALVAAGILTSPTPTYSDLVADFAK